MVDPKDMSGESAFEAMFNFSPDDEKAKRVRQETLDKAQKRIADSKKEEAPVVEETAEAVEPENPGETVPEAPAHAPTIDIKNREQPKEGVVETEGGLSMEPGTLAALDDIHLDSADLGGGDPEKVKEYYSRKVPASEAVVPVTDAKMREALELLEGGSAVSALEALMHGGYAGAVRTGVESHNQNVEAAKVLLKQSLLDREAFKIQGKENTLKIIDGAIDALNELGATEKELAERGIMPTYSQQMGLPLTGGTRVKEDDTTPMQEDTKSEQSCTEDVRPEEDTRLAVEEDIEKPEGGKSSGGILGYIKGALASLVGGSATDEDYNALLLKDDEGDENEYGIKPDTDAALKGETPEQEYKPEKPDDEYVGVDQEVSKTEPKERVIVEKMDGKEYPVVVKEVEPDGKKIEIATAPSQEMINEFVMGALKGSKFEGAYGDDGQEVAACAEGD